MKSNFEKVAQAAQVQPQCMFCKKAYEEGHNCQSKQQLQRIAQSSVKYI